MIKAALKRIHAHAHALCTHSRGEGAYLPLLLGIVGLRGFLRGTRVGSEKKGARERAKSRGKSDGQ